MGGGTGGGMAIDLANLARSRMNSSGRRGAVECVMVCTCLGNAGTSPLSVANTYALLTELQFASVFGNQGSQAESSGIQPLESRYRPFDLVYCVPAKLRAKELVDDGLSLIARQLCAGIDRGRWSHAPVVSTDGDSQRVKRARAPPVAKFRNCLAGQADAAANRSIDPIPGPGGRTTMAESRLSQRMAAARSPQRGRDVASEFAGARRAGGVY